MKDNKNTIEKIKKYTNNKSRIYNYALTMATMIIIYLLLSYTLLGESIFSYKRSLYISIAIYILFALGLNIIVGVLGQLNLGYAGFIAIGAYAGSYISKYIYNNYSLPDSMVLIIAIIFGGMMASLFSLILSYTTLRLSGDYLAIITLAFGEIIKYIIQNLDFLGGAAGFKNIPDILTFNMVYIILMISIVVIIMILTSRYGRMMKTIRENEIASENIGINTKKVKVLGVMISAFFAGVGGVIFSHNLGVITPDKFSFIFSIEILVIVVFGGLGSITGSIFSAVFITLINEMLRKTVEFRILIYSLILIILMIFRSKGIFGTSEITFNGIYKFFKKVKSTKLTKKGDE